MNKTFLCKLFVSCVVMLFFIVNETKADSPLTSTYFHTAYKDLPNFENPVNMYEYLLNDSISIEYRLAVINRSGWDFNGKNHAETLLNLLVKASQTDDLFTILGKLSGYQLICIAYLKAMDNYFNVEEALLMATLAETKEPKSYAVNLISSLIKAQYVMDYDWGAVYLCMDKVRHNDYYHKDMRPEASSIIFEYTDMYKDYVK